MNIDHIASEAFKLDPKSRVILAEMIWESLENFHLRHPVTTDQEAINLAIKRDEEIEHGAVTTLSHKELMHRLHRYED